MNFGILILMKKYNDLYEQDGAIFHHWRRVADEGLEYPFVRFNKIIDVPTYSDLEYQQHLLCSNWTKQETDHLLELCKRFDLRYAVIC